MIFKYVKLPFYISKMNKSAYDQCCGAGGAEIILGPRAGAENKF